MLSRALILVALLGAAMAVPEDITPGICYGKYKESATFKNNVDTIRFQSLDHAFVIVDEEIEEPTLILYDNDKLDGLKSINFKTEEGELLIGAANSDRNQCVHLRVPVNFDFENIIADDNATVALAGPYTVPLLKLHIINGFFLEANTSDTSLLVDYLILNNTGVGHHLLYGDDDSVSDIEIFNGGNGDAIYTGAAGNAIVKHDGIGNVQLGKVAGGMEVFLTGQGDISTVGGKDLRIEGSIKHPYQVMYQDGKCDLEAIMGNALFQPCKKVSSTEGLITELTTIAG